MAPDVSVYLILLYSFDVCTFEFYVLTYPSMYRNDAPSVYFYERETTPKLRITEQSTPSSLMPNSNRNKYEWMKSGGVSSEMSNKSSYATEDIIQKDTPKMRMSEVEKKKMKQAKKQAKDAEQTREKKDKKDPFVPSGLAYFS